MSDIMTTRAKADDKPITVRFPRSLIPKLDEAALAAGRSRNSEIVFRLNQSLSQKK